MLRVEPIRPRPAAIRAGPKPGWPKAKATTRYSTSGDRALGIRGVQALIERHGGASLLATSQVTQKDAPPWLVPRQRRAAVSRLLGKRTG